MQQTFSMHFKLCVMEEDTRQVVEEEPWGRVGPVEIVVRSPLRPLSGTLRDGPFTEQLKCAVVFGCRGASLTLAPAGIGTASGTKPWPTSLW